MKVIYWDTFWTIKEVKENNNYLFLYGDNDAKFGKKGQAIIRDLKNTSGIPTKKYPSYKKSSYYCDEEYKENKKKIKQSIELIMDKIKDEKYDAIVFPKNGFGTGLADLENCAPKTFKYLNKKINKFKKFIDHTKYENIPLG